MGIPVVRAVAVVVAEDEGGPRLVAHGVLEEGSSEAFDEEAMHEFLAPRLLAHMVPSAWLRHDALPKTPNGKVDRRALVALGVPRRLGGSQEVDGGPVLAGAVGALRAIFEDLLGQPASPQDSFFALGGHSLLATRLVSQVRNRLQVELPVSVVFEAPTPEGLAKYIEGHALEVPAISLEVVAEEGVGEGGGRLLFPSLRNVCGSSINCILEMCRTTCRRPCGCVDRWISRHCKPPSTTFTCGTMPSAPRSRR